LHLALLKLFSQLTYFLYKIRIFITYQAIVLYYILQALDGRANECCLVLFGCFYRGRCLF
jgi:hypothetical protein